MAAVDRKSLSVDTSDPFGYLADTIRGLMDNLGIERAHLVGNSYGGACALRLALDTPERVDRAILMGPGGVGTTRALPTPGLNARVQVAVSNTPAFGGVLGMRVPGAAMTDGLLDVIVVEPLRRPRRAFAVGRAALGRPKPLRGVHTAKVRTLRISAADHQEITLDGELSGELPATIEARRKGIRVVVGQA